ncbi:MAG: lipase [Flavobacterium psychrophilum]|nr:MAG: lipase [Flavobacterium psychrophilum]
MKKLFLLPFLCLFLLTGCSDDDSSNTDNASVAKDLLNVSYGNDPEQLVDIYLPAGRSDNTKVIILLHGGSWVAGNKSDMTYLVPTIKQQFPNHAIVNINYRLATANSPAFPKQIQDIERVIELLESNKYTLGNDYAFIGFSAGAHLAMLYSYAYDTGHDVKAVCDVVGPADFTDPEYLSHPLFASASQSLIGNTNPTQQEIVSVNPLSHITAQSPPTISFYGGVDPLVPSTQGPRLKAALDSKGVYNEFNFYENGGHADWDMLTMMEVNAKIAAFLNAHL